MNEFRSERRRRFSPPESSVLPDESTMVVDTPPSEAPTDGGDPLNIQIHKAPSLLSQLTDDSPWKEIDDFARSGDRVVVRSLDGVMAEAKCRASRRFNAKILKWVPVKYWTRSDTGARLTWDPVAYRDVE